MAIAIKDFAYKKQGLTDGLVNGVLNGMVTYFMLSGIDHVAIISSPGGDITKSLMGSMLLPAVIIAFVISLLTTKTTIKKRLKGDVTPKLDSSYSWVKGAIIMGFVRSVVNLLVVYGIGGIFVQIDPNFTLSTTGAAIAVFIMAGVIAYIESVSAIRRTLKEGDIWKF
ncbi:MAG: hypothetical protein QM503_13510 [Bacteroidota bacterium]